MKTIKFLLIALISSSCFAQNNFEKGYIVNNSGTRTECFIKNEDWKSNPSEFAYKLSPDSDAKTGNLQNVSEFGIDDFSKFIRVTVNMDKTYKDLNNYDYDRTPKFTTTTVFLKALKEGDVSLYCYEENITHIYFVKNGQNTMEQLINKPYKLDESRVTHYQYYKQQLINSLQCDGIKASIEKTEYDKSSLIGIFDKYYKCSGQNVKEVSKDKGKTEFHFYVTSGVSFRSYSVRRVGESAVADFGTKPCPRIGVELEAALPFNHGNWRLFVEPNFEFYTFSKDIPTYGKTEIKEQVINLPMGIRNYIALNNNSKLFIDLAFNLLLNVSSKGHYEVTGENFEVVKKSNFIASIGYAYKKYRIGARFNLGDTIEGVSQPHIIPESSAFSVILGYKFL